MSASEILDQIDFNSQQIYQNLKLKNINVPKEFVDTIFNKFILNLDQISQMGSSSFQFSENSLKNFQINYLNKINNPILGFYYPDLKTNLLYLCDTYMKECVQSDEKIRLIKNDLIYEENVYHLISFDIENQINKNLYKIDEKIYLKDFGNSEVLIDYANKILTINIKDSKRILMFGDGILKDWSIEMSGNLENEVSKFRQDENSLTGCLTFYDLFVENIIVNSKNNNCEDAINFLNTKGTIEEINVTNSIFDAVDIDYSDLIINKVFIDSAGNDCLDLSFSNLQFLKVQNSDCGDKSISIGEKTNVVFGQTNIKNSNTGVAIKDSSIVYFKEVLKSPVPILVLQCIPKQEFDPLLLKLKITYVTL